MNKFQRNIYRTVFENEIPIISCSETTSSGGVGVTEYTLMLDKPLGGIVIMDFDPQGVPDKLEIIHNGVKKATSGMTVANSGPFDNIYGEPTIPDTTQAIATDQFIGTIKGAVPNRDSIFLSETGITDIVRTKQQLIWWVYTQTDYELLNNVIVRVTGIDNTAWTLQRLCTNQVPTGVTPPTGITIINLNSNVDQCGPGDDTKIVVSSILLSSPVTVNTEFIVETFYNLNGDCIGNSGSVFTNVNILAGQIIGDSVGCGAGAPSFPSEITSAICYQNIISHDNTIDNIII